MSEKIRFEYLDTNLLIPYIKNARKHSDFQINQIAASIREFGFISPIVVDRLNTIVAGHGRLLAAQKLGLETVPVVRIEHLTETQRKAYTLIDNTLALNSTWDDELLKLEIAELAEMDFDLDLLGFDKKDFVPDLPDDDEEKNTDHKMQIIVSFDDMAALEDLFQELNDRGFKVKV